TIEHLKNPSLVEIRNYYNKYYVPNNMAAIFSGDFNPDEMIKKVDKTFSYMAPKPLSLYNPAPEKPLTQIQTVEVFGPAAEMVEIYYRGYAESTRESLILSLIKSILMNGKAGLIDINLNKQQKTLRSSASYQQMKDYGVFNLSATPRAGQTLEEAAQLVLGQVELLKKGEFDESLLKAINANDKIGFLQAFDSNNSRAEYLSTEFIQNRGTNWNKTFSSMDEKAKITKAQVVAFANQFFKDNYVIGYKRKGVDKNTVKVDKPAITPINANAGLTSPFVKQVLAMPVKAIAPKFLDYKKDIVFGKAGLAEVLTTKNTENPIFRLSYRINIGSNNYKLLPYAANYLTFLGTDKYSAEELSKAFYNIACTYSVNVGADVTTVSVSGLQENFEKAVSLVEHILANVKPNEQALASLKGTILKSRENNKLNKAQIMNGLTSYAQYGAVNPFNNVLSNDEVKNIKAEDLISMIHNLTNYEHVITYYGPKDVAAFTADIKKVHLMPKEFTPAAPAKVYTYSTQNANQVYFANYDMVQSEIRWLRNTGLYNKADQANIQVFNSYFGGGMGSIVFQTIRESKALAYSTFAQYVSPDRADKQYSMIAYVGSQADKMTDAINGMNELLNVLPQNDKSFELAKSNVLNSIETTRVTKDGVFFYYFADKKLGYDYDSRIDLYKELKPIDFATIKSFHTDKVANKPYSYLIVASDKKVKLEDMQKFGNVTTLTLEQLFGY
ncbi:MAG: insulinase family protein, partial [Pedobacter sp.]|nr:insulinase family protein [Pedobacter sp.]